VISSVVLLWEVFYTRLVESVINGTFVSTSYYWGLAEGAVDITPLNERIAAPGMETAVEAGRKRIIDGGFNVFDGVMETNDGGTIGETGRTLSDDVILGSLNWYYRTVIE
jgi:basic membrane protein A